MKALRVALSLFACFAASFSVVACDSEPETAPPRGAAALPVSGPVIVDGSSKSCAISDIYTFANPKNIPAGLATNGEGLSISCSVKPSGSGFAVSVSISGSAAMNQGKSGQTSFTISGSTGSDGKGEATMLLTASSLPFATGASKCTLDVSGGQIAAGRVAGTFSCERIDAIDKTSACKIEGALIAFENCEK